MGSRIIATLYDFMSVISWKQARRLRKLASIKLPNEEGLKALTGFN